MPKESITSLLKSRELGQSPAGKPFHRGGHRAFSRWAEADFLRHASSEYVDFQPSPRSSIAAAFSPDGRYLASTHGDHTVKVTEVATGKVIISLAGHRRTPWVVRFNPADSDIMASGSLDFTAIVWQISTGRMLYKCDFGKPIASLAFDPSGTVLVVSAGHKVFSWQFARMAAPVKILKTRRSLRALHFHPTAPHILLTAEVLERRAAGGEGAAANPAQQQQQQQQALQQQQWGQQHGSLHAGGGPAGARDPHNAHLHHHQQQQQQFGGGAGLAGGAAAEGGPVWDPELETQEAVADLAAFLTAHNNGAPQLQLQQLQLQQQPPPLPPLPPGGLPPHAPPPLQQRQGDSRVGPPSAAGQPAWPLGLLRNLLTGVTGVFSAAAAGGGAAAAATGAHHSAAAPAAATAALGLRWSEGSGPGHAAAGGPRPAAATAAGVPAAAAAGGGGAFADSDGGAPSVNPGGWGTSQSLPGNDVMLAMRAAGGHINVIAPADVVRHQSLGGGVRHAIPLVTPAAAQPPPSPPLVMPAVAAHRVAHRAARGGAPSAAGMLDGGAAAGGRTLDAAGAGASGSVFDPYDVVWGWDHSPRLSERDVERVRQSALRALQPGSLASSAAPSDTACIVTVRLWEFSDPGRELRRELLVLPRVALCSEMGIHFSSCGRFLVCCAARDTPSEACLRWQATQMAAAQAAAAEAAAATRTHARPRATHSGGCGCEGGDGGEGAGDEGGGGGEMDDGALADQEGEEGLEGG
ncbi:hypothetical protein Agub_g11263, partial [Astrephomene gubernaculifera]